MVPNYLQFAATTTCYGDSFVDSWCKKIAKRALDDKDDLTRLNYANRCMRALTVERIHRDRNGSTPIFNYDNVPIPSKEIRKLFAWDKEDISQYGAIYMLYKWYGGLHTPQKIKRILYFAWKYGILDSSTCEE